MLLASLVSGNIHAQDATSSDLEEVNIYESLNTPAPEASPSATPDVQMSNLEEQDDLQSLKEDIGETSASSPADLPVAPVDKKGPLNVDKLFALINPSRAILIV